MEAELVGTVQNGVIVLNEGATLPEGTRVRISVEVGVTEQAASSLGRRLLKFAGAAEGLPSDFAENHDHYLHGTPKR